MDSGQNGDGYPSVDRVVSLVPSITEALASVRREALVGATDWCTHPADLDDTLERRVRGTKNPDLAAIRALRPDLVIANHEENRELDVRRLRESGVRVHVTRIETVPEAIETFERALRRRARLAATGLAGRAPRSCGAARCRRSPATVAIPIWRDPWMVVGGATFTGDLARRLGWANAFAGSEDRYPTVDRRRHRGRRPRPGAAPRRALRLHRRRRPRGVPRTARPGWSAAGCSPGTAPRCSRPAPSSTRCCQGRLDEPRASPGLSPG